MGLAEIWLFLMTTLGALSTVCQTLMLFGPEKGAMGGRSEAEPGNKYRALPTLPPPPPRGSRTTIIHWPRRPARTRYYDSYRPRYAGRADTYWPLASDATVDVALYRPTEQTELRRECRRKAVEAAYDEAHYEESSTGALKPFGTRCSSEAVGI
ncbi:hypothetical protein GGR56DRAFT_653656 [Xylariaceae sp. FL0804]|nr:hypothetical protein GGR56DRAFT_653656 [Xylariaceae sp. FL0804]